MTDRNTDIAQAAHDAYPHETWIFIDGGALGIYTKMTGNKVTHCGSLPHESVQCFWDSPDGLLLNDNGNLICPNLIYLYRLQDVTIAETDADKVIILRNANEEPIIIY